MKKALLALGLMISGPAFAQMVPYENMICLGKAHTIFVSFREAAPSRYLGEISVLGKEGRIVVQVQPRASILTISPNYAIQLIGGLPGRSVGYLTWTAKSPEVQGSILGQDVVCRKEGRLKAL